MISTALPAVFEMQYKKTASGFSCPVMGCLLFDHSMSSFVSAERGYVLNNLTKLLGPTLNQLVYRCGFFFSYA